MKQSISGSGSFTDPVALVGPFGFVLSGIWSGTVTVEISFDEDPSTATWEKTATYLANIATMGDAPPNRLMLCRVGFRAGEYASGTAVVEIAQ